MIRLIVFMFVICNLTAFSQSKKDLQLDIKQLKSVLDSIKQDYRSLNLQNKELHDSINKLREEVESFSEFNSELKLELKQCTEGSINIYKRAQEEKLKQNYVSSIDSFKEIILKYPSSAESVLAKNEVIEVERLLKEKKEQDARAVTDSYIVDTYDEFKKLTFYSDKRSDFYYPAKTFSQKKMKFNVYFSIGTEDVTPSGLRLELGYKNSDWLFVENAIILVGEEKFNLSAEFKRDSNSGGIIEWCDVKVNSTVLKILKAIVSTDKAVKLRFNGDQYYTDFVFNEQQIKGLRNILNKFENFKE